MHTLTIFTPAYNRAHTIGRTYESLCNQTCKDFEWLIIDDGSSDNTKEIVEKWIKDDVIPIRYIYQDNQGMHGAHNTAYKNIKTELVTWVDSDDWMPHDAVEKIINFWKANGSDKYAGFAGLDQTPDGKIIGMGFPKDMEHTTYYGYHDKGGYGDKKIVYRTNVITKYPEYPIFEGEKYLGLAYKFMLVDKDYELLTLNEPLVTVEYQQDGSSFGMWKQYWNNPKGFAFFRKTEMLATHRLKRKFIVCAHYVSSCIISKQWDYVKKSPLKFLTIIATPIGIALYYRIRYKVRKNALMQIK